MHGRPSLGYQLGLAVVAVVMVLLPAVYVGLVLLVGWGVWHHATSHFFLVQDGRAWWLGWPLWFGPLLVGEFLILSLVLPLLARGEPAPPAGQQNPSG